jgi:uncharacterized protein YgbK (DUF1537 family)
MAGMKSFSNSTRYPELKVNHSAPIMGVVADDITGSNDIGIMFTLSGYYTCVYPAAQGGNSAFMEQVSPDVCIINTNSRLDSAQVAYDKVFQATLELKNLGCTRFFNKTCSVFRGNIGPEFDAMLDALGLEFAIVVLGYPKNSRTTIDGIHYVHARPLAESEFRTDPIHPMQQSNLVDILQSQTRRVVDLLPCSIIDQGIHAVQEHITRVKHSCNYLIFDVRSQADLYTIAAAVRDEMVLCGSSALAEVLPEVWNVKGQGAPAPRLPTKPGLGVLCISGSLMPQTRAQIQHLAANDAEIFELDSAVLSSNAGFTSAGEYWVPKIADALQSGLNVVFHAGHPASTTPTSHTASGLTNIRLARRISTALAEIGVLALEAAGQNRLIVAGGETSDAVCNRLGVKGLVIWQEIEPGLPSCITFSDPSYMLVLKSGSFGTPAFLSNAIQHLLQTDPYP